MEKREKLAYKSFLDGKQEISKLYVAPENFKIFEKKQE